MLRRDRAVFFCAVLAAVVGIQAGAIDAATIITNLNGNDQTASVGLSSTRNKAMGFTMPAGINYRLNAATLRLNSAAVTTNPTVQLWSNGLTNLPNAALVTLTNPAFTVGTSNFVFTPPTPFTLQAGTTYWLTAYAKTGTPAFDWMANQPGIVPTGIATHFGQNFDTDGPPPTGESVIFNSYSLDATPVPEPVAISIALFLVPACLCISRRRRA